MNIVKSTALFLTAIHATNAGLRGAPRELAASETDPEPERGPYHYKLSQAKWGELQSPGSGIKIAPNDLGFNIQFAVVDFGIGGVRDLHW